MMICTPDLKYALRSKNGGYSQFKDKRELVSTLGTRFKIHQSPYYDTNECVAMPVHGFFGAFVIASLATILFFLVCAILCWAIDTDIAYGIMASKLYWCAMLYKRTQYHIHDKRMADNFNASERYYPELTVQSNRVQSNQSKQYRKQ